MKQPFESLYLELLKKTLIDYSKINSTEYYPLSMVNANWKTAIFFPLMMGAIFMNLSKFRM